MDSRVESRVRDWALEHMEGAHFKEIEAVTAERVGKVWPAGGGDGSDGSDLLDATGSGGGGGNLGRKRP